MTVPSKHALYSYYDYYFLLSQLVLSRAPRGNQLLGRGGGEGWGESLLNWYRTLVVKFIFLVSGSNFFKYMLHIRIITFKFFNLF